MILQLFRLFIRAEEQAQELKLLQGQLADYNLIIDRQNTNASMRSLETEAEQAAAANQGKNRLHDLFLKKYFVCCRIDCRDGGTLPGAKSARRAGPRVGAARGTSSGPECREVGRDGEQVFLWR
jgi:hypothetical protein